MDNNIIYRQDAIDELTENKEMINAVLDSLTLDYNTRRDQEQRRGQIIEDIETIKSLPSAQLESCEGCKHLGKWINEIEYGYPSPCTRCKRKVEDHYER